MKKITTIIFLLISIGIQAQEVSFVSEKLEKYIKAHFNLSETETVQQTMIDTITDLNISDLALETAADIIKFPSLKRLNASNNKIREVQPFTILSNLEYLDLSHNDIDDISDFLMGNIDKITINIAFNYIKELSIVKLSPISYITLLGESFQKERTNKPMVYLNYINVFNDDNAKKTIIKCDAYISNGDKANVNIVGGAEYKVVADGLTQTIELPLQDISNIEVHLWYEKKKLVFKNNTIIPTANAGTAQTVSSGALVTLDGSASADADGDALTYQWTAPEGITLSDATAVQPTFTAPTVSESTDYEFTLVVNDGKADSQPVSVVVTVEKVATTAVTGITLNETSKNRYIGDMFSLTATVLPENATNKAVSWSSSDEHIATVDANGMVNINGDGNATITATTIDGGFTASCNIVSVAPIVVTNVVLSKENVTKKVGETEQLIATVSYQHMPDDNNVIWSSSNENLVTVTPDGLVTAKAVGTAIITATPMLGGFPVATCTVTVTNAILDSDSDGVEDSKDKCPNTPAGQKVDANGCSQSQLDDDKDGVMNDKDQCPNTPQGETVDAKGCSASQLDDDNDGVMNNKDQCPNTPQGETVDAKGCSQSQLDDDNDGVKNDKDQCPNTPQGETVDAKGCSQSQLDDDNDGVKNNKDQCPNTPQGEAVDSKGCSQSQLDDDNDSVKNNKDQCPNTPQGETVDAKGCSQSQLDDDNDGVKNNKDQCPNTPQGETVDAKGCSQSQLDDDNDGVMNNKDQCPNTPQGETVDAKGCSASQLDDDNDGVKNNKDQCPNTPQGETVDAKGCSQSQLDDDNDGVKNDKDQCPNTPQGETVDAKGCSQSQLDDDNDGVMNNKDKYPNTPKGVKVDSEGGMVFDGDIFSIKAESPACPGTAEGTITVQNTSSYGFDIIINNQKQRLTPNSTITFSNLEAGSYALQFIPENNLGRELSGFSITVPEPKMFTAEKQGVNAERRVAYFTVRGSTSYDLQVNDYQDIIAFADDKEHLIEIPLLSKRSVVRISPSTRCRGESYEDIIVLEGNIKVHPRVSSGWVYIDGLEGAEVTITLITRRGNTVLRTTENTVDGKCAINISHLNDNVYFMNIQSEKENVTTYIYKR